mmetsp:Transcript_13256/g.26016  ORF Transcript_13256/g.26016 Transcript_13256/m.26016 type:complete len:207 (+) Transcript_13256:315-935(+)
MRRTTSRRAWSGCCSRPPPTTRPGTASPRSPPRPAPVARTTGSCPSPCWGPRPTSGPAPTSTSGPWGPAPSVPPRPSTAGASRASTPSLGLRAARPSTGCIRVGWRTTSRSRRKPRPAMSLRRLPAPRTTMVRPAISSTKPAIRSGKQAISAGTPVTVMTSPALCPLRRRLHRSWSSAWSRHRASRGCRWLLLSNFPVECSERPHP